MNRQRIGVQIENGLFSSLTYQQKLFSNINLFTSSLIFIDDRQGNSVVVPLIVFVRYQ